MLISVALSRVNCIYSLMLFYRSIPIRTSSNTEILSTRRAQKVVLSANLFLASNMIYSKLSMNILSFVKHRGEEEPISRPSKFWQMLLNSCTPSHPIYVSRQHLGGTQLFFEICVPSSTRNHQKQNSLRLFRNRFRLQLSVSGKCYRKLLRCNLMTFVTRKLTNDSSSDKKCLL